MVVWSDSRANNEAPRCLHLLIRHVGVLSYDLSILAADHPDLIFLHVYSFIRASIRQHYHDDRNCYIEVMATRIFPRPSDWMDIGNANRAFLA